MRSEVLTKPTHMAALLLAEYVRPGDQVVDATCGNGHDTALLRELVGREGRVFAFDIQPEALEKTRALLVGQGESGERGRSDEQSKLGEQGELGDRSGAVQLILASHRQLGDYVTAPVQAVVFNLGYLPGGDKNVTTESGETLAALRAALALLAVGGIVVLTVYSGHDEGRERAAVLDYLRTLDRKEYHCLYFSLINQGEYPPEVVAVVKK